MASIKVLPILTIEANDFVIEENESVNKLSLPKDKQREVSLDSVLNAWKIGPRDPLVLIRFSSTDIPINMSISQYHTTIRDIPCFYIPANGLNSGSGMGFSVRHFSTYRYHELNNDNNVMLWYITYKPKENSENANN